MARYTLIFLALQYLLSDLAIASPEELQTEHRLKSSRITEIEKLSNGDKDTATSDKDTSDLIVDSSAAYEEAYNEAESFAAHIVSKSQDWIVEANSLANILQQNISEVNETIQNDQSLFGDSKKSKNDRTDILDKISEFATTGTSKRDSNSPVSKSAKLGEPTQNIAVFVSFSMPRQSLRKLIYDAGQVEIPVYLRGFKNGSLTQTTQYANDLFSNSVNFNSNQEILAGLLIDPRAFRVLQVEHVPTFISYQGPLPDCDDLYCEVNPPEHDRIAGNISLKVALEILSNKGAIASNYAKLKLTQLERLD